MQGTVLYGARDIRFEDVRDPAIVEATDAIISLSATCICGMQQAIASTRPGGSIGYVGGPHGVQLDGADLFFRHVHLHGGPAPVRRYLPQLIDLVFDGTINPGRVFDLVLPLPQVADGYPAMDERRAIKTLLRV